MTQKMMTWREYVKKKGYLEEKSREYQEILKVVMRSQD